MNTSRRYWKHKRREWHRKKLHHMRVENLGGRCWKCGQTDPAKLLLGLQTGSMARLNAAVWRQLYQQSASLKPRAGPMVVWCRSCFARRPQADYGLPHKRNRPPIQKRITQLEQWAIQTKERQRLVSREREFAKTIQVGRRCGW